MLFFVFFILFSVKVRSPIVLNEVNDSSKSPQAIDGKLRAFIAVPPYWHGFIRSDRKMLKLFNFYLSFPVSHRGSYISGDRNVFLQVNAVLLLLELGRSKSRTTPTI
ncbi:hypothetical protein [Oxynema aestuarii]|uniref:Uncharacterized protein n=1 Tax=Oxynema aestuarii AP17 TaxID=2064643 RepID=A0A6H1TSU9_9CYAN|nr:hypothetical protein [Oxynema aestuarii]QIZ69286.1 hypothetical protein HCG48_00675 [Oxynema aestuarii AP17]